MESLIFAYHKEMLLSIKRAKLNGIFINAKPILLISIMDAYSLRTITDNKITISEQLIDLYHNNSKIYQPEIKQTPFYKPFFHLTSDGFWFFKLNEGYSFPDHAKTPSLKWQKEGIQYAYFSDSLYELVNNNLNRERLKEVIILQFFKKNN
jgi:putative restriction endonuclease